MSRAGRIARRSFLIGSVAIAGGVAFGAWRYHRPDPNPLTPPQGGAAINPFVMITADGVTLIVPRADKGQGAQSIQAYMLAEELDIDPETCLLEPGPPAPAYYNGAVLAEGLPFLPTDDSWLARTARDYADVPAKLLGLQMTGGSSTVPDMYDRLRHAGAVARETLKQAAALREGLVRADLDTRDGAVILPDGRALPYTDLAADAATIEPVTDIVLRDPAQWKYLGKPLQRTDIVAKSTGTQAYGIDIRLENMVYAVLRPLPRGARNVQFDPAPAMAIPGVRQVVAVDDGIAVVGETTWHAMQGADALTPTWDAPDYPGTQDQIWQALDAAFAGDPDSTLRDDGDIDAALTGAAGEVTAEYRVPFLAHAPLEPMNATALVQDGICRMQTGTQIPRFAQARIADALGIDDTAVQLEALMIGGSFGHRLELGAAVQAAQLAAAMPGIPVKLTWTRAADFILDAPRPAQIARARGKASPGRIEALDLSIAAPSLTRSWFGRIWIAPPGPDGTIVAGAWDQPLAIPDFRVRGYAMPDPTPPVSSWRSVGASGNGFILGGFLDEMFAAADQDPVEGLLALCGDPVSRKVIEEVASLSNWSGRQIAPGHGRGVAFCLSFGVPTAQVVEVMQTDRGLRITRAFAVADVGRILDPVNFEAQLSGGMLFGLGHAMNCELTYQDHMPQQVNYNDYQAMRIYQAPEIIVKGLENADRIRGIGEPGVPPAAPALANAIFAATGQRLRELPLSKHVVFA